MPRVPAHRRQTEGTRQDCGVTGGTGLLDRHAGDARGVPVEQLGWPEPASEQDGAGRHGGARLVAVQRAKQPTCQILQIGEPFAQIGVGYPAHSVVQLAGDALHRRFGRQPAVDHLGDPL